MQFDLNDKFALVTGGARGIGREISLLLAQVGAEVIIHYHKSKEKADGLLEEIARQGGKAEIVQADTQDPRRSERSLNPFDKDGTGWISW
jgi:3-oxoacyl-[acyl-carrier protein] reductase